MYSRPRRLRSNAIMREMVAETRFSVQSLMYPMFVTHGKGINHPIGAMPGISHFSPDTLVKEVEHLMSLGINKILLFGVGEDKDPVGSAAYDFTNAVANGVRSLKAAFGNDLLIATDVCMCAYTDHGHCGILHGHEVANDETLTSLAKMALMHAQAGADIVAPSDMMDGRVAAIRDTLDAENMQQVAIMSYSVKFASGYYGPFREAADSAPSFGDRKTYQMDVRNSREAIKEALLDVEEGADILMVKPALAYMDLIRTVKDQTLLPLACYNVSGEYSMVKAAAEKGWIDEQRIVMENMASFTRAGADIIITYHAKDMLSKGWV
ncbi:MAG TPA: porphobilinogen synthase [Chitinophagales bacterium]|nr:porphobilinogen synthase [Chitinophagales bacterium]HMX05008.1 porphobilinogen synthase [Chitinophagales bacterium]HMZ89160.1 porphobilinogen synthase [Chitinophagales bacterium]HNE46136.1 porphobilinogen synthase [Chitinophagales bacterium]HNF68261.1 porphobilinogen synthase [Chitinophagales bacterium]